MIGSDMKKNTSIILIAAVLVLSFAFVSFAEEEQVGFVKKMWRNLLKKEEVIKEEPKAEERAPKAAERTLPKQQAPKDELQPREAPPVEKASREEMLDRIDQNLSIYEEELASKIENITRIVDEHGKNVYVFKKSAGETMAFEDLDDDTLYGLYRRILNETILLRTDRLNRQLQQIQQVQNIQRVQQQVPKVVAPPTIQRPYTPPQIPEPPPKPPTLPPQPPTRRR